MALHFLAKPRWDYCSSAKVWKQQTKHAFIVSTNRNDDQKVECHIFVFWISLVVFTLVCFIIFVHYLWIIEWSQCCKNDRNKSMASGFWEDDFLDIFSLYHEFLWKPFNHSKNWLIVTFFNDNKPWCNIVVMCLRAYSSNKR